MAPSETDQERERQAMRGAVDDMRQAEDKGEQALHKAASPGGLKDRLRKRVQDRTLTIHALDEEFDVRYPTMRQIQHYGAKLARAGKLVEEKAGAEEKDVGAIEEQADAIAEEIGGFAAWLCEPTHPELDEPYFSASEEGLEVGMAIIQATTAAYNAEQEAVRSFRKES